MKSDLRVTWEPGPIAEATDVSYRERLLRFIEDADSEPLALFSETCKTHSNAGDWYGEHAGKWLVASSLAYRRTLDPLLLSRLELVVGQLAEWQEPSGYLGTYAADSPSRFTHEGAPDSRTWDLWVHAWMILGLLEASPFVPSALELARRIGDLLISIFGDGSRSVVKLGNHQGLSSAILMEPLALLTLATGDARYGELASRILSDASSLGLLTPGKDAAEIGTGKAYQLLWTMQGMLALYRVTADPGLLTAVLGLYDNVEVHHLTPAGGPWGGIGGHKEVFNAKDFFSPYGMVETCSTATWMSLSAALFDLKGEGRYAEAFERSFLNSLVGALDENGRDWCYFTFPNGRRNNTYHWACCKSSGAMALEFAPPFAVVQKGGITFVNLLLPVMAEGVVRQTVQQEGLRLVGSIEVLSDMNLAVRVPTWAGSVVWKVNGTTHGLRADEKGYAHVACLKGDVVSYEMEMPIRVHCLTPTIDHHGQEIVRTDYACLSWGPFAYACGLIDGFRKEETLRLPKLLTESVFFLGEPGWLGPHIDLRLPGRLAAIEFAPYAEAGGRHEAAWRSTWMQVAWQ